VLVIGAGAAGLAAAQLLKRSGASPIVIEARGRIGGRIATSRLWPQTPVELGAGWVHGQNRNPLVALAETARVGLLRQGTRQVLRDLSGRRREDMAPLLARAERIVHEARVSAETAAQDRALASVVQSHPAWPEDGTALAAALAFHVTTEIEHEFAADWSTLSAWWFDAAEVYTGGDTRPAGGFDRVLAPLADGLDLRLGAQVRAVSRTGTGVEVRLSDGARLHGRGAVVTLPLGVLQAGTVAFDPPLAPMRRRAIGRLAMGQMTKLALRFDHRFWERDADWLGLLGAAHASWVDATEPGGAAVLVGFKAGAAARVAEGLPLAQRVGAAMTDLRAAYDGRVPEPTGAQASRWHADPFARGAYSFLPPGSIPEDRSQLGGLDWDGRLAFAGEACTQAHPATVHGALETGRAAAAALA
jgi:monoamine oxidase